MSETREDVDLRVQSDEGFNDSKQLNIDPNIESSSKTNIKDLKDSTKLNGSKINGTQGDTQSKLDVQSQQKNFAETRRKTLQQRKSISSINNGLRGKTIEGDQKTEENQKTGGEDPENKDKSKYTIFKERLDMALEHNATTSVMTIITLYALFGDDIRILVTNASGDPVFWVFNIIAMFAFTVEILISSIVKKDYWLGFFFWLDVISTASLILDIGWVNQQIFQSGSSGAESAASLARAGRASRVGTKAGRIVRIVRLIRLVKLYKHAQQAFAKEIEEELSIEQEFQQQEQKEKDNQLNQQFEKRGRKHKKVGKHRKSQENQENASKKSGEENNENGENAEGNVGENEGDEQTQLMKPQNKNKIKLPPLENNSKVHDNNEEQNDQEPDGPSKPQPLEQFKDDPLLKKENSEEEDIKKAKSQKDSNAELVEQTPIKNSESDENDKKNSKKSSVLEIQSNANQEAEGGAEAVSEKKQESLGQIDSTQKKEDKIATGQTIDPEKEQLNPENNEQKQPSITMSKKQLQEEEERKRQEEQKKIDEQKVSEEEIPQETIVGKKLSDLTTRRVITLVMSIMFSVPLFTVDTYYEQTVSYDNGLKNILAFEDNEPLMADAIDRYVQFHADQRAPVIYIEFYNTNYQCCRKYPKNEQDRQQKGIEDWEQLRQDEITYYIVEDAAGNLLASSITNNQTDYILNAILSLVRTVFVSVILGGGALLFSKDVQELVLDPIKNMLDKIVRIAKNPLEAAQIEQNQALAWEILRKKGLTKELDKKKEEEKMETAILEKLIIKIGALLALGFGEAGSEIIAQNMQKTGEVDPFIPGKKMMAIFGFCNIHNFQEATEVLQSNIMVYVNEIAEITHGIVDRYSGQSNKNIGEAFLVVWVYDESHYSVDPATGQFKLSDKPYINEYSDLSVIAFLKIQAAIYMNKKLSKYNDDPDFQKRIQNFRVKMGFGLHLGWAIEGAIGSTFKIDASYLSPHVNMASRLEHATKQFGTQLLISEALFNVMSAGSQYYCRKIDRVTVKGSKNPVDLYTVDCQVENIDNYTQIADEYNKKENNKLTMDQKKKKRVLQKLWRKNFVQQLQDGKEKASNLFMKDRDLQVIQEIFIEDFPELWEEGFDAYIQGDWEKAANIFNQTKVMLEEDGYIDGPSQTLLNYMAQYDNVAPDTWKNYRELTEK